MSFNICLSCHCIYYELWESTISIFYQVKSATDGRDETVNEQFPNKHLYIICYSGARHGI